MIQNTFTRISFISIILSGCLLSYAGLTWSVTLYPPKISGEAASETGDPYHLWLEINPLQIAPPIIPEIYVDWGDNTNTGWFVPLNCHISDVPIPLYCNVDHLWASPGVYSIEAKSRDPNTLVESSWSDPLSVQVTLPSNIIAALENPSPDLFEQTGISPIYGWALHPEGIKNIELFIDAQLIGNIPYGAPRPDVKEAYPESPGAANSGFAMVYNFSQLSSGTHEMKVKLYNLDGQSKELVTSFSVLKFHGDNVQNISPNTRVLRFNRVTVDGSTRRYDIGIKWFNEIQGFKIISIIPR
jgi:hypothetical protein